ncbi:glucose-6-phosphatase 3 [Macrosteles quadrilineatus]|uniref:glucose-6-phosphatase 3 n=1 Tax=Macrosteles quadrilineatus TaxID=74068 RepID=UPI0023E274D7|nr:glucose-6-phosphatase 3 [Macrosteles quadrilineatus]
MAIFATINLYEAIFISTFQKYFLSYESWFLSVAKVSDPAYAMSILFPVAASVNTPLGADILVVTLFAEWLNTILKWLLMEDRPFWWVREQGAALRAPELRQTLATCETGPGSPSGHVMGFAAVLFALMRWVTANFVDKCSDLTHQQKRRRRQLLWVIVLAALMVVSMSRIFVAAHFPHQCLLGAVLGLALGYVLTDRGKWSFREKWRGASRYKLFVVSLTLICISVGAYLIQLALGIDPQWSVRLAFKWCRNPEFVHVVTTPIFSLVRVCGASLGLAMASPITLRSDLKFYPVLGVTMVTMMVISLQMLKDLIPTANAVMFYVCQFFLHATLPFLLLFIVPVIASLYKVKEE